jgi:rhodanese-related sulfurtransferase
MEKRYHVTDTKFQSQGGPLAATQTQSKKRAEEFAATLSVQEHFRQEKGSKVKHTEGFLRLVEDAKSRVREISVAETLERISAGAGARLVDVREDREWEAGHARGAEHMGRGIIERDIETAVPGKDAELILYCGGGFRSALAADNLQRMGYTNVHSLAGGWKAWKEAGAPVEDGEIS